MVRYACLPVSTNSFSNQDVALDDLLKDILTEPSGSVLLALQNVEVVQTIITVVGPISLSSC